MAGIKQIGKNSNIKPKTKQDKWLLKSLDKYLTRTQTPPRKGVFFPSLISNSCDRYVFQAYNGLLPESIIDSTLRRIFDNGSYLENRIEKYFSSMGILKGREVSLKFENPPISGRMDFLIMHEEYGYTPVELKSINTRGFESLRAPKKEHIIQLHIYINLFNYENKLKVPATHGIVLYENKNDQKIKAFIEQQSDDLWNKILERLYKIMHMLQAPEKCTGDQWCKCIKEN